MNFEFRNISYQPDGNWTEIPYENIKLMDELGSGAFGVVYKGEITEKNCDITPCAVKALKGELSLHPTFQNYITMATWHRKCLPQGNLDLGISFYYILCVDISVIKPWIKMIPVKWNDIVSLSEMISYHFTGLNCPIKQIAIIWLDQSGCTLYFSWRPASNLAGRIALQFYRRFLVLQLGGLVFFKLVIWNKQIFNTIPLTGSKTRSFAIWY